MIVSLCLFYQQQAAEGAIKDCAAKVKPNASASLLLSNLGASVWFLVSRHETEMPLHSHIIPNTLCRTPDILMDP